jgi:hypothetical protein
MQSGTNWFDPGTGDHLIVDGHVVERDALRIAEAIKDYDENLELICLDPDLADVNDAPFIVCERRKVDGALIRIMEAWQLDDRILERIYAADTQRSDVLLGLEKKEAQLRRDQESRYQEKRDANKDLVESIVKNMKSKYTFEKDGKRVTLYDDRPAESEVI